MVSFTNVSANSIPVVNLPFKYVDGLELSYTATTAIQVAAGQCRDSTDTYDLVLSADTDLFTSINGAGGLDTGDVAATTMYAVFVIGNSIKRLPTSTLMSLSSTAPVMPTGYDLFRRVGYIRIDSSFQVTRFYQTAERRMVYAEFISVITGGNDASFAPIDLSAAVPAIPNCSVLLKALLLPATAGNVLAIRPTGSIAASVSCLSASVLSVAQIAQVSAIVGIDAGVASIDYQVSQSTDAVNLYVISYVDQL